MDGGILAALGGTGMFLFGMAVMTDALRAAAGGSLRRILARFTATPLRGALTGAAATAAVQSSSAVTVMTLGFVGAGLMTFPQSLGVLYGANVGTTATGWIVTLVGIKLDMARLALPLLFVAALAAALGPPSVKRAGQAVAGLALLFLGIGFMQAGMAGAGAFITPDRLPDDSLAGRLQLILIGTVAAAVLQSSSAGIAVTLVLLGSGAIGFAEAAAIVVGLNIGTCVTGLIAVLGGTRPALQAAVANILFNVASALAVLPLLGPVGRLAAGTDPQLALVLFHTGLNVAGVALFLPFTAAFARLVTRLVPDHSAPGALGPPLDPALLADPDAALDAAQALAGAVADAALAAVAREARGGAGTADLPGRTGAAMAALQSWLARIAVPPDRARTLARYTALLHQMDHTARLIDRASRASALDTVARDAGLRRAAAALAAAAERAADPGADPARIAARFARLAPGLARRAARHRRATLLADHVGLLSVPEMFRRTDAMRWVEHVAAHAERIAHYRAAALAQAGR